MSFYTAVARQLRKPSGLFGRLLIEPMMRAGNRSLVELSIDLLDPAPGAAILDIGFGGGDSLLSLCRRTGRGRVVGVDYSPEMAARGKRRCPAAAVALGDAAHLPFGAAAFDAVLAVNTVYFWPDLATVFAEIARVLKPAARFAIGMRSPDSLARARFAQHGFTVYSAADVAGALGTLGFTTRIDHRDQGRRFDRLIILGSRPAQA